MPAFHAAGGTSSASSASCRHAQQLSGLLSPPSGFSPRGAEPAQSASIVRSGSTVFHLSSLAPPRLCATTALNGAPPKFPQNFPHIGRVARSRRVDCSSLPSQPFITPLGASLFLHLPRGQPVKSPFASFWANRRRFTPDSLHSLPLRRGSEASLHCRASSGLPTLSPLLLLYFQLSHTSNAGPTSLFTLFIFS